MKRLKIPYGESDYRKIKTGNYVYVDKTKNIETLENLDTSYPVFLRPRRFGKSLLVSTLFYYYDRNSADEFDTLFADTYIGTHKTELAGQYYVLRFDFSGLNTTDSDKLYIAFYLRVEAALRRFCRYYNLDVEVKGNELYDSASILNNVLNELYERTDSRVYIMIDEYDHFANNIIGNQNFFRSVTGKDGFVRNFYEVFKSHTGDGCIDRIFITGVTSMTLDSLTSGFNIAKNVSARAELNEAVGFTEDETRALLEIFDIEDTDEVMDLLINHYNGYKFHLEEEEERVLGSNLVLYFLSEYLVKRRIPRTMIDSNIRSDYQKLTSIFELYKDVEKRGQLMSAIMEGRSVESDIVTEFTFSDSFTQYEFLSMLYYLGLLTLKGPGGVKDALLEPPNAVIRDVYYKYYADYLNVDEVQKSDALSDIAFEHDFDKFNVMVTQILRMHSNDDFMKFNEARLKTVFLSALCNQNIYLIKSEYESSGKRPDIALFDHRNGKTNVKYNYLIELKYIMKKNASELKIKAERDAARRQMMAYLQLDEFRDTPRLKGLIYVVVKDEIVCFEEIKSIR